MGIGAVRVTYDRCFHAGSGVGVLLEGVGHVLGGDMWRESVDCATQGEVARQDKS